MADNTTLPGTGTGTADIKVATRKVTYSGDAGVDLQAVGLVTFAGSDDAKTPTDVTTSNPLPVAAVQTPPTTGTTSQVNDTASSTTLLSSDATRKGFRIWNDSTSTLYVKYGTTASATDCTVRILADGYFEENFYSGRVDGIWSVDASGAARITALT